MPGGSTYAAARVMAKGSSCSMGPTVDDVETVMEIAAEQGLAFVSVH